MVLIKEEFANYSKCPHIRDMFLEFSNLITIIGGGLTQEKKSIITEKTFHLIKNLTLMDDKIHKYKDLLDNGMTIVNNYSGYTTNQPLDLGNINSELSELFNSFIIKTYINIKDLMLLLTELYNEKIGHKNIINIYERIYGKSSLEYKMIQDDLKWFLDFMEIRRQIEHEEFKFQRLTLLDTGEGELPNFKIKGKDIDEFKYMNGLIINLLGFTEDLIIIGYNYVLPKGLIIIKNDEGNIQNKYSVCMLNNFK